MSKKQKKNLLRIIVASVLMVIFHFLLVEQVPRVLRFLLYMIPYLVVGYDILWKAGKGIKNRQPFDESLLMAIATLGAIGVALARSGDYTEAIAVMLFYQVGEWFQSYAVGRSRKNITELMDICPDYANLEGEDGSIEEVDPEEVEIGSVLVVKPGEKIPIDGVVVEGTSTLDTAALTGESVPRTVKVGDEVISGCINQKGLLKIKTSKEFGESTVSKVLELIEEASSRKSKSENFITKFARIYTPIVVYSALALAILYPLGNVLMGKEAQIGEGIYRAMTFLVISCPCALVVSIPLSFFAGIGCASHLGILVKGSNYMETLSEVRTVVFDKTGTLTQGVFEVTALHPDMLDQKELLHFAAHVERYSTHPIGESLKKAFGEEADGCQVEDVEEIAGYGVSAMVNQKKVYVGNAKLMEKIGAKWHDCHLTGTVIHVAVEGEYAGHIVISDRNKKHAGAAISALKQQGITKTVMLTGDVEEVAKQVANDLGIDLCYSDLLPQDKVSKVEELLGAKEGQGQKLAFVGDGINDAPVLSRADVGVAMGAMGSDAAIEAADLVLMDDDPLKLATAIRISKTCLSIVHQNIYFAICVKVLCLLLGALGFANMWLAVFADVGVMVLAVLNAIRCMFVKEVKVED